MVSIDHISAKITIHRFDGTLSELTFTCLTNLTPIIVALQEIQKQETDNKEMKVNKESGGKIQ